MAVLIFFDMNNLEATDEESTAIVLHVAIGWFYSGSVGRVILASRRKARSIPAEYPEAELHFRQSKPPTTYSSFRQRENDVDPVKIIETEK